MVPLVILLSLTTSGLSVLLIWILLTLKKFRKRKGVEKGADSRFSVGILHPHSPSPEERILWGIVSAIQYKYPHFRILVYTGERESPPERILANARSRLGVSISGPVEFVYLRKRHLVDPWNYPRFPCLGINFGGIALGLEALAKFVPDVYLDTIGLPLTFPIFKYLGGCRVGSYLGSSAPDVIYASTNPRNYSLTPRNKYFTFLQRLTTSKAYRLCSTWAAEASTVIIPNSTWTEGVVSDLWEGSELSIAHVYPPCPVETLRGLRGVEEESKEPWDLRIISLTPFSPEGDHPLQLRSLFQLRHILTEDEWDGVKLVLIGTSSTPQESARLKDMEDLCKHLSLEHNVTFKLNLTYPEVMEELGRSLMSIHTMASDPFSIGLVECMAGGVLCVGHNSGGTAKEITIDFSGCRSAFLATDEMEYAEALKSIIRMGGDARALIRSQARRNVERFSEAEFRKTFLKVTEILFR